MKKNSSNVSDIKRLSRENWVQLLLLWFQKNKRDLPWRKNRNPYFVWISEIMLQQTRVTAVIPYFNNFTGRYPTVRALASSSLEDVYKEWEGLGYYSRAANIYHSAKIIMQELNGEFPTEYNQLLSLKGIGEYTAGAIMSLAYNRYYPAVDGNVLRVLSRMLGSEQNILDKSFKSFIQDYLIKVNPEGYAREFTEALMELGALICEPINPKCTQCPLYNYCEARKEDKQNKIPVRIKTQKIKTLKISTFVIQYQSMFLLQKRSTESMMKNLFGYPTANVYSKVDAQKEIKRVLSDIGISARFKSNLIGMVSHEYSHQKWNSKVYYVEIVENSLCTEIETKALKEKSVNYGKSDFVWVPMEETVKYPISRFFRKVEELLGDK